MAPFKKQPCIGLHGQSADASHYRVVGSFCLMTWDLYTPDTKGIGHMTWKCRVSFHVCLRMLSESQYINMSL